MNLFVPDIGTLIKLDENWSFVLYNEYRNRDLLKRFKETKNQIVELPKGLVLKIARIYIKKGLSQYSSITFSIPNPKNKSEKETMPHNIEYGGATFWAKLHDCNGISFSLIKGNEDTTNRFQNIYKSIENDAMEKFGVEKCTKILQTINRALPPGQNTNNLRTHLALDQFLSGILSKFGDDEYMVNYLRERFQCELRDFRILQIMQN